MVLGNSTAQYAFLQTLASTYVWTMYDLLSAGCISSPQIFYDCTDYSHWDSSYIPSLPTSNNFYTDGSTTTYSYTDYTSVTFSGITAKSFTAMTGNLTTAARGVLAAACSANSTCAKKFSATPNATSVLDALVATNINTVKAQLSSVANASWFPHTGYAYYSQIFTNLPDTNSEVYGMHNAAVQGMAVGSLNASAYLQQRNLGTMLQGGAAMYESLIHTLAIGSWSQYYQQQSNINLTGTQVFTNVATNGGLDTRATRSVVGSPKNFANKWQVWQFEAHGLTLRNRDVIFDSIKSRSPGHRMSPEKLFGRSPDSLCSAPGNLVSGINWLQDLNNACGLESFLSGALNIGRAFSTANTALNKIAKTGIPGPSSPSAIANKYFDSLNSVLAGWMVNLCGASVLGNPCYPGSQAWSSASSLYTVYNLLRDVAEFSNPVGAALGYADLFCAVAPVAANYFLKDYQCCSISCTGASCQSSTGGCTQGTGVC